jgi:hypothetical protein
MSLQDPVFIAQGIVLALSQQQDDYLPPVGDRLDQLLEAGTTLCCSEGDLLALMPSVEVSAPLWRDDLTWLRRILGF